MHIGLICAMGSGHTKAMVILGKTLKNHGHKITLVVFGQDEKFIQASGLDYIVVGTREETQKMLDLQQTMGEKLGPFAGSIAVKLIEVYDGIHRREVHKLVVTEKRFDALLVDQVCGMATVICQIHNIRFARVCNALPMHMEKDYPAFFAYWKPPMTLPYRILNSILVHVAHKSKARVQQQINEYRIEHEVESDDSDIWEQEVGLAQFVQQPAFLDFPRRELHSNMFYTRPWHDVDQDDTSDNFPWDRLDGRPLVYASMGTLQTGNKQVYFGIVEACRNLTDIQLVLSLGRRGATWPTDATIPPNVVILDYVSQLKILRKASLVITHAGQNTALEALAVGVPMVAIPLASDQPGNAARLERIGVAEVVIPIFPSSKTIGKAIQKVLSTPTYQQNAERYATMIQKGMTLDDVANLIQIALKEGRDKPLRRDDPEAAPFVEMSSESMVLDSREVPQEIPNNWFPLFAVVGVVALAIAVGGKSFSTVA